ncbi:hypothetical protein P7K49_004335 [Saguinus oedipus]|uniref:Uncharacterized protein n=1 Tax=Saguinus oedipus TaxID=9490 RepID=A0ABQ9W775_SAGOE|nr:hypothetical protein P7K49_004335 [Saguinus oedipus]
MPGDAGAIQVSSGRPGLEPSFTGRPCAEDGGLGEEVDLWGQQQTQKGLRGQEWGCRVPAAEAGLLPPGLQRDPQELNPPLTAECPLTCGLNGFFGPVGVWPTAGEQSGPLGDLKQLLCGPQAGDKPQPGCMGSEWVLSMTPVDWSNHVPA